MSAFPNLTSRAVFDRYRTEKEEKLETPVGHKKNEPNVLIYLKVDGNRPIIKEVIGLFHLLLGITFKGA